VPECAWADLRKDGITAAMARENLHHRAAREASILLERDLAGIVVADHDPLGHSEMRRQDRIFSVQQRDKRNLAH
jgi:hypothetical protein